MNCKTVAYCNRAAERAKKRLERMAVKKKSIWEDFGQDEVRKLNENYANQYGIDKTMNQEDWLNILAIIDEFRSWCYNFDYNQLQSLMAA